MASLSQFNPLESLVLPSLGSIDSTGLTLVVGPNSSGKSQLLRDIHKTITGDPRTLVVAKSVGVRKLPYEPLMDALVEEGYIYRFTDDNGAPHIRPKTTHVGTGQSSPQVPTNQIQTWHSAHQQETRSATSRRRDEYLFYMGGYLVTALFLEPRLTALNQIGLIDFVNQHPTHDLHALYLSDNARAALLEEIRSTFAKTVWPDMSRGNAVCLKVSDDANVPSADDRLSPTKMAGYRTIETEGDGLKSYAATCVALLLGRRPLCIVDEPEMCLHPPQAYNLGRFIGRFGSSREGSTFVATHSSHVLRGVIQTAPKLQIIRLTRVGSEFSAHVVPSEALSQALAKPTVRAESVLDGIFAQAVAILEADGDRTVYQAVWETLDKEFRLDIHFAAVGGTGGIADTCALYRTLQIPVAVIADLDIIADSDRLRRVLQALRCPDTETLVAEAQSTVNAVKKLPPTISPEELRAQIAAALPSDLSWDKDHDGPLRAGLQRLARKLDRMRRLKGGEEDPLPPRIQQALYQLISKLSQHGLFVVPLGELENWLGRYGIKESKQNKWAWANEAAAVVRRNGAQVGDVWDFMRGVGRRLTQSFLVNR